MKHLSCCPQKQMMMAGALALAVVQLRAQAPLPQTILVPVIFYDYKADQSNPNFEPPTYCPGGQCNEGMAGLRRGMVQSRIGLVAPTYRKPLFQADLCFNNRLNEWFIPSGRGASTQDPTTWRWNGLVAYLGRTGEWTGPAFTDSDPMANVVIYDNLQFTLFNAATGTYRFDDQTFFPLDGRGFGPGIPNPAPYGFTNPDGHNYSFSMELHHRFVYREGLHFDFRGDDDVWAFVNDSLVMDLGGIHGPENGSIDLVNLGLVQGTTYNFDFFYCERHVTGSDILITTNLVAPITVDSLHIEARPAVARIPAGDSVVYLVTVYLDSAGVKLQKPEYNELVQWSVSGDANNPGMSNNQGSTSTFYGRRAWVTYTVTATLRDPVTGTLYTRTMTVTVDPGPPTHVVIEPDSVPDKWTPEPVERVSLPVGVTRDTVYAVLRDRYENLVSLGTAISWNSMNTSVAGVGQTPGKPYEGAVTRGVFVSGARDSTRIIASQGTLLPDTAWVVLLNVQKVEPVIARPGDTTFTGSLTVTLTTATPGATIWYCINCATPPAPGAAGAILYTGPITISAADTTRIRAVASKPDYEDSDPTAYRYVNDRDNRGPNISHAYFYLGNPPGYTGPRLPDTLLVVFDEPVQARDITSLAGVFDFTDDGGRTDQEVFPTGTPFELVYAGAGDSLVAQVRIIFPSGTDAVTPGVDQITIQNGTLRDVWGNTAQDSPARTIEWGRAYDIIIAISQNPVRPGTHTIDWSGLNLTPQRATQSANVPPNSGTVLKVSSVYPIDPGKTSMIIYDALGNIVRDDFLALTENSAGPTSQCYFIWDISNRNNRLVGSGTYLAVLNVRESGTGKGKTTKQKIGVMR